MNVTKPLKEKKKRIDASRRARTVGASVLPYMVDPTFKEPYFILGRERRTGRWRECSESWSDFGGRRSWGSGTPPDEDATGCAAREFWEESLGLLAIAGEDKDKVPYGDPSAIRNRLDAGEFLFRLIFKQADGAMYETFVVEVPWDAELQLVLLGVGLEVLEDSEQQTAESHKIHRVLVNLLGGQKGVG